MPTDPNANTNSLSSLYSPPKQNDGSTPAYSGGPGTGSDTFMAGYNIPTSQASFDPTYGGNSKAGGNMTGSQGQIYGGIYNQAQNMAGYFNQAAAGYNQHSPQINDNSQLAALNDYYTKYLNGDDAGYAELQYKAATDQSIASQMAMAGSTRGGASAMAGAQRAAQQGAGTQMAAAANQSAQIRAQEEQQAAQGLMGVGQAELGRMSQNAQLQQNNQQQINAMQTALYGMGEQEQGMSLSAQQAYMANLLAAEGINTQQTQFNTQLGVNLGGAALQTVGAGVGAAVSDERLKTDVQPEGQQGGISHVDYSHPLASGPNLNPNAQDNKAAVGTGAGMGAASGAVSGALSGGPVGAVLGGAGGALQGGLGSAAQSHPGDQGIKTASTATSAGVGAASGAALGSAFGPVGTAIGGITGGIAGLVKGLVSDEDKKYGAHHEGISSVRY